MSAMFTCTIRKISTGHKITAFQGDSLDHLRSIGLVLVASPNYSRCYIVCTDWQGNVLFNLQPQASVGLAPGAGLPAYAPPPAYPQAPPQQLYAAPPPPPPPPAWNQYQQQEQMYRAQAALPAYRRPPMPESHTRVIDAEFEVMPALPPARY